MGRELRIKYFAQGNAFLSKKMPIFNIGIKHGFPCINICQVPREVLKTKVEDRGF